MAKYIPKVVPEPTWETRTEPCNQFDLVFAFQWYNHNKDNKDARKYLIEYLVKNNLITATQKQAADYLNQSWNIVDGWLARCLSRGAWVPDSVYNNFLENRIPELKVRLDAIIRERNLDVLQIQDTSNVISIQERVTAKVDYFIMELEAKFDEVWHNQSGEEFVPYTWMIENEVKPMHASKIAEYFKSRAADWISIIESKDEYVKESYPRPRKEMIEAAKFFTAIATDAEKLASNKNAARKPRKKKPVSFEKKVKNLKFKKDDTENKLVSIDPVKIMGAQKLWIYNVKNRRLGIYVAKDEAGLAVKGSSIENYKYSESISKTLRKPKEVLSRVLDGGKVVLRKVMGEINSKPSELNGRINKDTILLRVE